MRVKKTKYQATLQAWKEKKDEWEANYSSSEDFLDEQPKPKPVRKHVAGRKFSQ